MPSIRALMDTFGHPPSEIVEDWLWQIESTPDSFWQDSPYRAAESVTRAATGEIEDFSDQVHPDDWASPPWQAWEVDREGRLQLNRGGRREAKAASRTLRSWLGNNSSPTASVSHDDQQPIHPATTSPARKSFQSKNLDRVEIRGIEVECAEPQGLELDEPTSQAAKRPVARKNRQATARRAKAHGGARRPVIVGSIIGLLAIIGLGWSTMTTTTSSTNASNLQQHSDNSHHSDSNPLAIEGSARSTTTTTATTAAEAASQTTQVIDAAAIDAATIVSTTPAGLAELHADPFAPTTNSTSPLTGLSIADSLTGNSSPAKSPPRSTPSPQVAAIESVATDEGDVMRSVDEAMRKAEAQADSIAANSPIASATVASPTNESATESSTNVAPSKDLNSPSLSIFFARDMLRQKLELPKRQQPAKGRDESWSVELALPDQFIAEPDATQSGSTKRPIRWCLFETDAKSPRTCIVIQVDQRNPRERALTASFCASAEDLPQLALPLDRKYLDPLRASLQTATVRMRALSDAATIAAASGGSLLGKDQRQTLKVQLKLAERLCEVVADADRLASLLEGEVELDVAQ